MKKLNNCKRKWECLFDSSFVSHFIHYMVNVKEDSEDWLPNLKPCLNCDIIKTAKKNMENKNGTNG